MENILSKYDKSPGIISPDFEKMDLHLPKKAVFAFLGEKRIERFAFARGGEKVGTFVSLTKDFPLWMIKADKEELCVLQAPAGASAAVLLLERLYAYGVEKVVALGCCGALEKLAEQLCRKEVVIATETGCGVVPIDAAEREAREAAGRLSILLAKRAQKVIRVWCGLPESLR